MTDTVRTELVLAMAQGLVHARRHGQRFTPPADAQDLSPAEAYAVQAEVAQRMAWFAGAPRAWKAGGAPTVSAAPLPAAWPSPHTWQPTAWPDVPPSQAQWVVEAELAFTLGDTPPAGASISTVLDCIDTVAVAIETIDTRLSCGLRA